VNLLKILSLTKKNTFRDVTIVFLFFHAITIYSQKKIVDIERDYYYTFNDLLPYGTLNDLTVKIKFLPTSAINGCKTNNYISVILDGSFKTTPRFLSLDIMFKDCNNAPYSQTICIPLSRSELKQFLKFDNINESRFSNVLGLDNNNPYNNDFTYLSEKIEEISNVRLTTTYAASKAKKVSSLENPKKIDISNEPGEENTVTDRAELNSKIELKVNGGKLPPGGEWIWYADEKQQNIIGKGSSIIYKLNGKKPEISISVIGRTSDKSQNTISITRKVYLEVKKVLLKEIETLLNSNEIYKAQDLITQLEDSYQYDTDINKKSKEINAVILKKEKEEESKAKQELQAKIHNLETDFPEINKSIKTTIQNYLNENLKSKYQQSGTYDINLTSEYKINDRFYFENKNSIEFSNSLTKYLNSTSFSFNKPKISYGKSNVKSVEVNASSSYLYKISITNKEEKVKFKNNKWETNSLEISNLLSKNYNNYYSSYPNGTYKVEIRTISFDNKNYYHTSGILNNKNDGPGNAIYSVFIPSVGRNKVGLKNGKTWTLGIIGLAAIAVGSKYYSNLQYDKFLIANDQSSLDKSYNNANIANKISLVSAGLSATLYTINIVSVLSKGINNKKNPNQSTILPLKIDTIFLP
jgi:hypothetical protein